MNNNISDDFIDYISPLVGRNGIISQRELAYMVGCTEVSISRYLNKERNIPFDIIIKICNTLNVDSIWILKYFNNNDLFNRISNLSNESIDKLWDYINYLEYQEKNNKLVRKK